MSKKGSAAALTAALALALTACSSGSGNNPGNTDKGASPAPSAPAASAQPEPQEAVTLKVTGFKSGSELGALPELNDKFMKENPDIKVEYEGMPGGQFKEFIKTRFASNDASDVIMLHPGLSEVISYGKAGYLYDLTAEPWISNFTEASLKATTGEGKIFAIPNDMNVLGVYYNKKLFSELSIATPQNWDEFLAAAEKIKASGKLPISIGNNDGWMTLAALYTMAPSLVYTGTPDFDSQLNGGTATFAQGWQEMNKNWFSLDEKGYLTPKSTGVSLDQAQQAFAKGEAAMYIDGSWSLSGIKKTNPDLEVGMFAMPSNAAGKDVIASAAVGTTFAINKDTKVLDAAKKYLEFWSKAETQTAWAKSQQAFMTIKGETGDLDPAFSEVAAVVAAGKSYPFLDQGWINGGAATAEMMTSAQGVYLKAISPQEMLENMDKAWKQAASQTK
ncbi:extracellular solute-binding protein [Paenibacillus pasadenensis]|uniref:ABC transporter substrate-binding protein n=1 Tax=Paenibacillus pasadenensis TaxID=217090 RepID=UPI00203C3BDA|nr:extracellular solute-binding protein [Paenibacillus pasadenensis]MCM3747027.1 extracellular solute-binding protein [Paenibacillus pasadenensis]